jgi:hypothetical protein
LLFVPRAQAADPAVPVVSSAPTEGFQDVHLNPLWTVGLDDDLIFGRIRRVVERPGGGVYVLDSQLNEVQALSDDGQWETTIGREGEAPGEFQNPSDLFLLLDGTLAVVQTMPPKIALLHPDGVPLDNYPVPDSHEGLRMLSQGFDRGDGLVLSTTGMFFTQGQMQTQARIFSIDPKGELLAHYYDDRHAVDLAAGEFQETDMVGVTGVWTLTPGGNVVVAQDWANFRLHVYAPDGDLLRVVERPFTAHVRTAEERDHASKQYSMNINGKVMEVQVADVDRAVDALFPRPEGGFRALIRERQPDDPADLFARLDEFDAEGRWVRELRLHGEVDPDHDRIFLGADRIYAARNAMSSDDEEDDDDQSGQADAYAEPLHLVCYGLER